MTWFRIDDCLHSHKKAMRAGVEAMGLWAMAGSWSANQLTDGWVPEYAAERLCPTASHLAERLVRAGLWVEGEHDGDKGWWFHQWNEHQPAKAEVLGDRAANARKSALYRDERLVSEVRKRDQERCRYCGTLVSWKDRRSQSGGTFDYIEDRALSTLENVVVACRGCNSRKGDRPLSESGMRLLPAGAIGSEFGASGSGEPPTSDVTDSSSSYLDTYQDGTRTDSVRTGLFQVPVPTRPDPSRPGSSNEEHEETKKRATRVPAKWKPTDSHRAYATEHDLELETQSALFLAHAETNDRRCASWNGAFAQWLIKADQMQRQQAWRKPYLKAVSGGYQPYRNPTDDSVWDEPLISPKSNGAPK